MKEMKRVYLDLWVPTVTEDKKSGRLKKKKLQRKGGKIGRHTSETPLPHLCQNRMARGINGLYVCLF